MFCGKPQLDDQYVQYWRLRDQRVKKLGSQLVKTMPADPDYAASGADAGAYSPQLPFPLRRSSRAEQTID